MECVKNFEVAPCWALHKNALFTALWKLFLLPKDFYILKLQSPVLKTALFEFALLFLFHNIQAIPSSFYSVWDINEPCVLSRFFFPSWTLPKIFGLNWVSLRWCIVDLFVFLAEDLTKLAFVLETKEGLTCQVPVVWGFLGTKCERWKLGFWEASGSRRKYFLMLVELFVY